MSWRGDLLIGSPHADSCQLYGLHPIMVPSFIDGQRLLLAWYDNPAEFCIIDFANALEHGRLVDAESDWSSTPGEDVAGLFEQIHEFDQPPATMTSRLFVNDLIHEIRHATLLSPRPLSYLDQCSQQKQTPTCFDHFSMACGTLPASIIDGVGSIARGDSSRFNIDYRSYTTSIGLESRASCIGKKPCVLAGRIICFNAYEPDVGLLLLLVIDANPRRTRYIANAKVLEAPLTPTAS